MLPCEGNSCTSWKIASEGRGPIKYLHRMCSGWQPFGLLQTWGIKDNDLYMCSSSWTVPDTANSTQYLSHTVKSTTTVPLRTLSGFRFWWQPQLGSQPCIEFARLLVERGRCSYPSPVVFAGGFSKTKVDQCFQGYFCLSGGTFGYSSSRVRLMLVMNGLMVKKTLLFCNFLLPLLLAVALLRMKMKQQTHCIWCKGQGHALQGGSSSPPPVLAARWALSWLMSFTFQLSTALSPSTELLPCLSFNSLKASGNGQRMHTQLHCTRWRCHPQTWRRLRMWPLFLSRLQTEAVRQQRRTSSSCWTLRSTGRERLHLESTFDEPFGREGWWTDKPCFH